MHRRYTVASVAAAIFDTDEAEESETEGMLVVQNEQEEESEIEEVMSDIDEEVSILMRKISMKTTKILERLLSHLLVNDG